MKVTAYLRVAKNTANARKPFKVDASATPNHYPLAGSVGNSLPTIAFAIELDVPDDAFTQAEKVIAEITIPEDAYKIAAEVRQ